MKTKRYKLKRDLPTFKAGDIFYLSDAGNLLRESDNIAAYSWTTLEKFPNILTDWFEEVRESTRWKPEISHDYYYISGDGHVYDNSWDDSRFVDNGRFEIGNCFKTKEEAERVKEYLKALAVVRGDATTEFTIDRDNFYVYYDVAHNYLYVSSNSYCLKNGIFGLPYFATENDAQRSIELHRNEWLTIFGFEDSAEEEE